jgi:hypothetical protein
MENKAKTRGGVWAVLAVAGLAATAVSLPQAAAAGIGRTIHVLEQVTNATYVPVQSLLGSKSASNAGDYIAFDDPLVDPVTTARVGHVSGQCTLVDVKAGIFTCFVNVFLTGRGQIASQGGYNANGTTGPAAITGGTQEFLGADGMITIKVLSATSNDWVIRLID